MISLSGLNPMQRKACEIIEGPALILAGAGSGKTRTITYRIAHMVDNLEIPTQSILAVSFTNKAAKEMRERVFGLLGKRRCKGLSLITFHSLGLRILKKEIERLGRHKNFTIYDTNDQLSIVRQILKNFHEEKKFDAKTILSLIGKCKNNGISEDNFIDSELFDDEDPYHHATEFVYRNYQEKLAFFNSIDFDDILFLTNKLFNENSDLKQAYSERFQYIMVDEYQDTNSLQFSIINHLTSTHDNICVVGDDDQAIYSFRGADISNILSFESTYPQAQIIKLEENYRSTTPILNLANQVIASNKNRREKTLWTARQSGELPLLWLMGDADHEAQVIVEDVLQHQSGGGHLGDIAVLYRSNNQVQVIEDELRMSQIPYVIIGGKKFYDKKEIKDLMAYLFLIHNKKDELSLRRILNVPSRGIGLTTLNKLLAISKEKKWTLFDCIFHHSDIIPSRKDKLDSFCELINKYSEIFKIKSLPEAISLLIDDIQLLNYIDKQYDDTPKKAQQKKNDVMRFIESAERFTKYNKGENQLKEFIERLLTQDSQDNQDENDEEDDDIRINQVTLMTMHSSKGLEFNKVYIIGMEELIIPHAKTIKLGQDISEERRLCYVGITRARDKLIMSQCKERTFHGKKVPANLTRFLHELKDKDLYQVQDRTTFGHMDQNDVEEYKKDFFANLRDSLETSDDSL